MSLERDLLQKIETLRKHLNELISSDNLQDQRILEISRELDELLLEYYKLIKKKVKLPHVDVN